VEAGLKKLGFDDAQCQPLCVFRKTKLFDIRKRGRQRELLWAEIRKEFNRPQLFKRLEEICFGDTTT
jgi:hypothetical protein